MSARPLVYHPSPILREICAPIERVTPEVHTLLDDMLETMYANDGLGLAAIQIGVIQRAVVIDVAEKTGARNPIFMINPELIWTGGEITPYHEGCLSLPELYEDIDRPNEAKVRYMDRDGKMQEIAGEGLLAKALQHEVDHLNGVLFFDHLSKLKKMRALKKYSKYQRALERQ